MITGGGEHNVYLLCDLDQGHNYSYFRVMLESIAIRKYNIVHLSKFMLVFFTEDKKKFLKSICYFHDNRFRFGCLQLGFLLQLLFAEGLSEGLLV